MRLFRRILGALTLAVIGAIGLRLRGRGGTPPQRGGWQPIDLASSSRDRAVDP